MNFIETIIENGFKETFQSSFTGSLKYNINTGWYGVTKQHPDAEFVQGNKKVELSLQGIQTYLANAEDNELIRNGSARYLRLLEGDKVIYETFSGVMPSEEIVNYFL